MRRSRSLWLGSAVVLFALAAWLMSRGDEPRKQPPPPVEFPRYLRPAEQERLERRRTLPEKPAPIAAPAQEEPRTAPVLDPLLAALRRKPGESAVVFEANALRHSPIGELAVDCFFQGKDLDQLRGELGFDPLEDVDRVAFAGEVVLVSGHFGGVDWSHLAPDARFRPVGEKGRLLDRREVGRDGAFALWNDELLLAAPSEGALLEAIDRLEGRAQVEPAIDEGSTYGELYGVIGAAQLAKLLPPEQKALAARLEAAAQRIELHVDASGDVAISADVEGPDTQAVGDLGRSLGAALAVARLQAKATGEDDLVELLDLARIQPRDGRFSLELALPLSLLEKHLGGCRDGRPPAERLPEPEVE